jgi:DtxR family Mn-dependent transcriptional regulator
MELNESTRKLLEQLWVATTEEAGPGLASDDILSGERDQLIQGGLAARRNGHLTLTSSGQAAAAQVVRRRRLAERLLADVLAPEEAHLTGHTCDLEQAVFDELADNICTLLGHPRFCPHGKPIPEGDCCRQKRASVGRLIGPLCDLQPGQGGHIAYIQMHHPQRFQKLMAMGVLPGVPVKLLRRYPSFVFEVGYSQFAVDEEIAADIWVRLRPDVKRPA